MQEPLALSDGSALELTVGRYLTPNGRVIDGVGIEPDVVVARRRVAARRRAARHRGADAASIAARDTATGRG